MTLPIDPPTPGKPSPSRYRRFVVIAAVAAVIIIAGIAYGLGRSDSDPAPSAAATSRAPSASALTARPAAVQVECVDIDRAHNAWAGLSLPSTASAVKAMNEGDVKMAMEDGDNYLDAVKGYEDQPSKALAVAIAEYNFELSLANMQVVMGSGVEDEQAAKVEQAVGAVAEKYQLWRTATCS